MTRSATSEQRRRVSRGQLGAVLVGGAAVAAGGALVAALVAHEPTPEHREEPVRPPEGADAPAPVGEPEPRVPELLPDRLAEDGVVRVGHSRADRGDGYLLDVAEAAFAELGATEVEAVPILAEDYHRAMERHLEAGRIDVALASQGLDGHLCSDHRVTDPATRLLGGFLVPEGNPEGIGDYADLVEGDLTLGVPDLGSHRDAAVAAGVAPDRVQVADPSALDGGEIDAYASDAPSLRHHASTSEGYETVGPDEDAAPLGYTAFVLRDDEGQGARLLNDALDEMRGEGHVLDLLEPHGVTEQELAPADLTADEACDAA